MTLLNKNFFLNERSLLFSKSLILELSNYIYFSPIHPQWQDEAMESPIFFRHHEALLSACLVKQNTILYETSLSNWFVSFKSTISVLVILARVIIQHAPKHCVSTFWIHFMRNLIWNSHKQVAKPWVSSVMWIAEKKCLLFLQKIKK